MSGNYSEHEVTPELLAQLFARMWPRGKEELVRLGMSLDDAFAKFLFWARQGESGVMCCDEVPIFASGVVPEPGGRFTWFQATEDFDKHASKITRRLRRVPGPLRIYSVLVHPDAERWFSAMGYKRDGWEGKTAANWPLFRFTKE